MIFCVTPDGEYYRVDLAEDMKPGAVEVPERPSPTDRWDGSAWVPDVNRLWDLVRDQREPLLTEADHQWNKAADNSLDAAPIGAYRQALRDITKQPDPLNVVWPERPW